ncbi:MAG: hypothetical protein GF398_08720 [Chitinivibrionales bacterium]|nr:hypothetical protein [Chitinivibrionales bacterium]
MSIKIGVQALCSFLFVLNIAAMAVPLDNPVANYYPGNRGYPGWTDRIAWDNVIDMSSYSNGADNFEKFENARDELFAQGGGVLYYPAGTYTFDVPEGPNGRGLLLKEGVVIRGEAPGSDTKANIDYENAGLSSLNTKFNFTATEYGGPCLMNYIGGTPADVSNVGIAWVNISRAYVFFGFNADSWASTWGTGDSWLSANSAHGWDARVPDGTHIMDVWTGDGTTGKWDSGKLVNGSYRFVFGCKLTNAKIHNYAINKGNCSSFNADAESWRFGGILSIYGSHVFVANNVVSPTGTSGDNRLVVDINKALLALYQNRCDVAHGAGYYAEDIVVCDNWVYNKGNKSFEISGTWVVLRDNIAHKEYLSGTPSYNSCIDGSAIADYMNRGFDLGGMNFWAHNNEVRETGSGGNDGEGMLVQRHNEVETFSHAWTDNRAFAHAGEAADKGYIAPYDVHVLGLLQLRNRTSGNVGIRKLASNQFADIAVVLNEADDGVAGTTANDFLSTCPGGTPSAPVNVSVEWAGEGVRVRWEDAADNEVGFRIDRKIGSGSVATIAYRPRHSQGSSGVSYAPSGSGGGGPCDCATPTGFNFNPQEWIDYLAPSDARISYRVVAVNCDDNDNGASDWVTVEGSATDAEMISFTEKTPYAIYTLHENELAVTLPGKLWDGQLVNIAVFDHKGRTVVCNDGVLHKQTVRMTVGNKFSAGMYLIRLRCGNNILFQSDICITN